MRTYVRMIVCVRLPRFELVVAAGGPRRRWPAGPLALAPEAGREQRVGEVSGAAEALGVRAGMAPRRGARTLPGADAGGRRSASGWASLGGGVARPWRRIGAARGAGRARALAYFEAAGLRGLHGGEHGVIARPRRRARARPPASGAGPTRFCALAAALAARRGAPLGDRQARERPALPGAGRRSRCSRSRAETAALVEPLRAPGRAHARRAGRAAAALRSADRFGAAGAAGPPAGPRRGRPRCARRPVRSACRRRWSCPSRPRARCSSAPWAC